MTAPVAAERRRMQHPPKSKIKTFWEVCVRLFFANLPVMRQSPLLSDVSSNRILHKIILIIKLYGLITERISLLIDPEELLNMPAYQLHDLRLPVGFPVTEA